MVLIPSRSNNLRRYSTQNTGTPPPLPPRRHSLTVSPLQLKTTTTTTTTSSSSKATKPAAMSSGYYGRASSPRRHHHNPARSSTGTFYNYDDPYYSRAGATSPRTSGERIAGSHHSSASYSTQPSYATSSYASNPTSSSRSGSVKYDSYTGRPRRNTLNETNDHIVRPSSTLAAPVSTLPIRAAGVHGHHLDRPSSPLARSWDNRAETYATHAPARREHKRIYSVDDNSHSAKLIAERDLIESRDTRRRDSSNDTRGYSTTTSGRSSYHHSKPAARVADVDEGYTYTDPAGMYRDTEPAWRSRPRSGSIERSSRPSSLIVDRAPRSSARELGPPPSTRGFDKIHGGIGRSGSLRDKPRSSSIERATRDVAKYDPYPDTAPVRPSSTRPYAPAVHQEPREVRRDSYAEELDRRGRAAENRRGSLVYEDRDVQSRGFGIAPTSANVGREQSLDRQPVWSAHETPRSRPDEYRNAPYYHPTDRNEVRMPEPPPRVPEPKVYRDPAPSVPAYDEPRLRESDRSHRGSEDRSRMSSAVPVAAGLATGAAATLGVAEHLKNRERTRERERELEQRDRDSDQERKKRREYDDRDRRERGPEERRDRPREDRRDRDGPIVDLRDRAPEEKRERAPEERPRIEERKDREPLEDQFDRVPDGRPRERRDRVPAEVVGPATAAYASTQEPERKKDRPRFEDEDKERRSRRAPSSDGSSDERPRHYVDRDAPREGPRDGDRRNGSPSKELAVQPAAALDPDEEYRRRIQQEAARASRPAPDRDQSDSDREERRRRRREHRDRSRSRSKSRDAQDRRSRAPPTSELAEPAHSRYNERSNSVFDTDIVQEPGLLDLDEDRPGRQVQIVTPPKEDAPKPKGILRKPTEKFPEDPDPIREGVAPHKSQLKGKDIPIGARWTKIDRRLVNPQALEEAKERFEERMDCVIVLRVLTKEQIQKLADRTKEIREEREDEIERQERRERRHRDDDDKDRRHRDEDDRDRRHHDDDHRDHRERRRHRDSDDDDDAVSRASERSRDHRDRDSERPRMIEDGR